MIQYVADLDALRSNDLNVYRINDMTYSTAGVSFAAALRNLDLTGHDYDVDYAAPDYGATYYDSLDQALNLLSFGESVALPVSVTYDGQLWRLRMTMQYLTVAERYHLGQPDADVFRQQREHGHRARLIASTDFPPLRSPYGEYRYHRGADGQRDRWEPVAAPTTEPQTPSEIASRLKELRTRAGMSQQQLADAAGISQQSVDKYESGARSFMRAQLETALRISRALGTPLEKLIG